MQKQRSLRLATVYSADLQFSTLCGMYRLAKWRAKFNTLIRIYDVNNSPVYNTKFPPNHAHSWTHRLAKLLNLLSTFRVYQKKNYKVLTSKVSINDDNLHRIFSANQEVSCTGCN